MKRETISQREVRRTRRRTPTLRTIAGTCLLTATLAVVVSAVANGQSAAPPSSGGVATETQSTTIPSKNLWEVLQAGGILMLPIGFCSLLTTVFFFERLLSLRRGRVVPRPFLKRFLHQLSEGQLDRDRALKLCQENGSPTAEVFVAAIRKWGKPAVEVEQAVLDEGERAVNSLRRYLRVFNGVSTISPLLGLLGTVFGMIRAFNDIAATDAMGRPELLAGGISEALITTAAGLTVAIPALAAYLFFVSKVDRLVIEIDSLGQELVRLISDEGLETMPTPRKTTRREAA